MTIPGAADYLYPFACFVVGVFLGWRRRGQAEQRKAYTKYPDIHR